MDYEALPPERERGIEAQEVVATLALKLGEEGYSNRTEIVDATEFHVVTVVGTGEMTVRIRSLPTRRLGPTLRLPRCVTEVVFNDVAGDEQERLVHLIDAALLRGGG